jgi:hypothetical protein
MLIIWGVAGLYSVVSGKDNKNQAILKRQKYILNDFQAKK